VPETDWFQHKGKGGTSRTTARRLLPLCSHRLRPQHATSLRRRQGGMAALSHVLASFVCGASCRKRRVDQRQAHAANPGGHVGCHHLLTTLADLPPSNHAALFHV
jgi:hypothetical protein